MGISITTTSSNYIKQLVGSEEQKEDKGKIGFCGKLPKLDFQGVRDEIDKSQPDPNSHVILHQNNISLANTRTYTKPKGRNMGLRSTTGGGEIVQVQGGQIIRATGRKDRHSKVFTAKGPRDRRVRLSAHTAIQFYDVQDRLGYDRPSKAVDWLMNKAKASIDKLAELPPWDPSSVNAAGPDDDPDNVGCTDHVPGAHHTGSSSSAYQNVGCTSAPAGGYVVGDSQPLSDSIMKSFFPTSTAGENANFQNYPHGLMSRGGQNQDLCLSLHTTLENQGSGSGYDGGWAEQTGHHQELGRLTRLMGWAGGETAGRGDILVNPSPMPPPPPTQQQSSAGGYNSFQRGTLQSSFSPFLIQTQHHNNQSSMLGIGHHGSNQGGFMSFSMPSQIHGGDHHHHHHHHHLQLHGGGVSMSNSASSSSMSPDSSQQ